MSELWTGCPNFGHTILLNAIQMQLGYECWIASMEFLCIESIYLRLTLKLYGNFGLFYLEFIMAYLDTVGILRIKENCHVLSFVWYFCYFPIMTELELLC